MDELDIFAIGALIGLLADTNTSGNWSTYAEDSYDIAEAMMAERKKRVEKEDKE